MRNLHKMLGAILLFVLIVQPVFADIDGGNQTEALDQISMIQTEEVSLPGDGSVISETIDPHSVLANDPVIGSLPAVTEDIAATPVAEASIPHTEQRTDDSAEIFLEPVALPKYIDGEIIVKYKNNALDLTTPKGRSVASKIARSASLEKKEDLRENNISILEITDGTPIEEKIHALKSNPDIEYVQPNFRYKSANQVINTNDPHKNLLWGLANQGQTVGGDYPVHQGTVGADVRLPEAWSINPGTTTPNDPVIVAVIDSGVAYNHPDLLLNMWDGTECKDENGNALGNCNYGYDYENDDTTPLPTIFEHGTHVAGAIAAVRNNGIGIIGIAPYAKIMALKSSLTTIDNIKSIHFAQHNGARIINASWTGTQYDQALKDAIETFPGLFITAAGNEGSNNEVTHYYPSDFDLPNIISVAATDQNDTLATFSNFGITSVDVAAPGTNIFSTVPSTTRVVRENFDNVVEPGFPAGWNSDGIENHWATSDLGGDTVVYSDLAIPYFDNADSLLSSPTYDITGNETSMTFVTQCDTEYSTENWTDYMQLEFSADGNNFIPAIDPNTDDVFRWDEVMLDMIHGEDPLNDSGTSELTGLDVTIPSSFLTNTFKFRFRWVTNDVDNNHDGCFIDDIYIKRLGDGSENKYAYMSGTSMATAYTTGVVALMQGYNPILTTEEIKTTILNSGDSVPGLETKVLSGKRINAQKALQAINPNVVPVISVTNVQTSVTPNTVTISWETSHHATSRVLYDTQSHSDASTTASGPINYGYTNSTVEDGTFTTTHSVVVNDLLPETMYLFRPISHGFAPEIVGSEIVVTTPAVPVTRSSSGGGGGGGGGGGSSKHAKYVLQINKDARKTTSASVTLTITPVSGATQMQISNTSDFTSASWIPFKETYTWILTPTQGIKTVYVRYGKNASVVGKAQDSITLTQTTPLGGASTAPLVSESMVKPAPVIKYSFAQTLTIGSRNQDVMELQKILIDAGYLYVNPPTNYFGPMTVAALKSYQKAHGLAQTGIVDHATQEILNGSSTQSHIENTTEKEELIKQLQVKLIELIAQLKLLKS